MTEDRVVVRGRIYERDVPIPSPAPPRPVDTTTRWRRTEISFGPVGRTLCTAVLLIPLWRAVVTGSLFWVLVTLAMIGPGALWLRDTWKRT